MGVPKSEMHEVLSIFGVFAGELMLNHGDNLSATLQGSTISAAKGQRVAFLTVITLAKIRCTDDAFTVFWALVQMKAAAVNVSEPSLPRRRKMPARLETRKCNSILFSWCGESLPPGVLRNPRLCCIRH